MEGGGGRDPAKCASPPSASTIDGIQKMHGENCIFPALSEHMFVGHFGKQKELRQILRTQGYIDRISRNDAKRV